MKKFYDREREMKMLENLPKGTNLIVVYGRRRIGKTRLILEHLRGKESRYVFIPRDVGEMRFLRELSEIHGIPRFASLKDAVIYLIETSENVFFDEFQNIKYMDASLFSYLQEAIDSLDFKGSQRNIFVAGSSNSMMREIFVDYSRPLYGRVKVSIQLDALPFEAINMILKDVGIEKFEDRIRYYSVFGGVPKYYEYLDARMGFEKRMKALFFRGTSPLREEGKIVLLSEFGGDFSRYISALDAIATGNRSLGDISAAMGIDRTGTNKYLDTLRKQYGLVKRLVPATEDPEKSKRGLYVLNDPFLTFWFRFVKRYENYYETGLEDEVYSRFLRDFPSHVSFIFEDIVKNAVMKQGQWERIGSWWNRRGDEIDIIALNEKNKEILFGEVKWRNRPIGCNLLEELKKKKELVDWHREERKEKFLLVSKSGFTKKCIERMDEEGIMHWNLKDVQRIIE